MSIYFSIGQNKNKDSFITAIVSWIDVNTNEDDFYELKIKSSKIIFEPDYIDKENDIFLGIKFNLTSL